MRILGIDPGVERVGFGLIIPRAGSARAFSAADWGVIKTPKTETHSQRLMGIYDALTQLLKETQPDWVAVEKLFFFKNAKTLVPVSQARGVILLCIEQAGLPLLEFTPMQVKQNLTGYGKAEKSEIQDMVARLLEMPEIPKPDDAADALALAISAIPMIQTQAPLLTHL